MAKKSSLERESKRKGLVNKYLEIRLELKKRLKKSNSVENSLNLSNTFQKLPRNSSKIRLRNRCWKTGRPRGFYRFSGLCRNAFRELSLDGFLPGITKASW
jgi:small subunit ribosomal protein S14